MYNVDLTTPTMLWKLEMRTTNDFLGKMIRVVPITNLKKHAQSLLGNGDHVFRRRPHLSKPKWGLFQQIDYQIGFKSKIIKIKRNEKHKYYWEAFTWELNDIPRDHSNSQSSNGTLQNCMGHSSYYMLILYM